MYFDSYVYRIQYCENWYMNEKQVGSLDRYNWRLVEKLFFAKRTEQTTEKLA